MTMSNNTIRKTIKKILKDENKNLSNIDNNIRLNLLQQKP